MTKTNKPKTREFIRTAASVTVEDGTAWIRLDYNGTRVTVDSFDAVELDATHCRRLAKWLIECAKDIEAKEKNPAA